MVGLAENTQQQSLSDNELERFSRQLIVPGFDFEGQEALKRASVMIVGCGGLGAPAALYLAAAGIGELVLVDDDIVELSNLPRQIAYSEADIGSLKVHALADRLQTMNADITIVQRPCRLDSGNAEGLVDNIDLVVDATDNRDTRLLIDQWTARRGLPWFMGAAVQLTGQNLAFSPARDEGCYHCLSPEDSGPGGTCSELGILGPVVGAVALSQVLDVLAYLTGFRSPRWGVLRIRDFRYDEHIELALARRNGCPLCGGLSQD